MVARRASETIVTAPIIFLVLGLVMAYSNVLHTNEAEHLLHLVAEVSLVILLFLDASKIDIAALRKQSEWPLRMLLIGLPLSIGIGFLLAIPFFPEWPLALVALVAAILAPTDAALGQAVVSNKNVPLQERQTLTVESGLNDGLALPIILLFASIVAAGQSGAEENTNWLIFSAKQILLGPLVGLVLGLMGAKTFLFVEAKKYSAPTYEGIAALAMAGVSYLCATLVGGNGFIAAFVAGLTFGNFVKGHCRFIYEFTESEGQMLVWTSFLVIGLGLLPEALKHLDGTTLSYILISLFVVRPLAIYLSLLGTNTKPITRLLFGWFGPRGLATALFALLVTDGMNKEYAHAVLVIAINAVWISALLHGVTASPAVKWYAKKIAKLEK